MTETSAVECSINDAHAPHRMVAWIGGQKFAMSCVGRLQHLQSSYEYVSEMERQRLVAKYTRTMIEWTEGRKSTTNEMMTVEGSPDHRTHTLACIATADAAEVEKLSAAIQALAALDRRPR